MSIQLMIVDDHELVREGLRLTFEGTDVEVVAEASDGLEAIEKLKRLSIDVALVDLRMPRSDGFQFLEMLRDSGRSFPAVLIHSVHDGINVTRRCRELGAKGLLSKAQDHDYLLDAIRCVYAGHDFWVSRTI